MAEKLALKRLAGSDLSFFDVHFRNQTYGDHRQKGINLNTDVFVDQLNLLVRRSDFLQLLTTAICRRDTQVLDPWH